MKTDIPLKRLTERCPHDILRLLGAPPATVLSVESLELPMSKGALDCVLHLQAPDGTEYIHVLEWQGWSDGLVLWRGLSYLGWLGQHRPERPILLTIIYLKPSDDVGDILTQLPAQQGGWHIQLSCVRLWEFDAHQAVASGAPGLLALSPLMHGATAALVEHAAQQLIRTTEPPIQADLLAALGVFAEPLVTAQRFLRLITKERLMSSDLFALVYEEQLAEQQQQWAEQQQQLAAREQEWQQKLAARDQELAVRDQELAVRDQELAVRDQELAVRDQVWQDTMHAMLEETLMLRFPSVPVALLQRIRQIRDTKGLKTFHLALLTAEDLATIEQAITVAASPTQE